MHRRRFLQVTAAATGAPLAAHAQASSYRALLDRLGDPAGETSSPQGAARRRLAAASRAAALSAVDAARLSPEDRVLHAGVLEGARTEAAFRQLFPYGSAAGVSPYVVTARAGAHAQVAGLLSAPGDADALAQAAARVRGETERITEDAARAVVPPAAVLAPALAAVTAAIDAAGASDVRGASELHRALRDQRGVLASLSGRGSSTDGVGGLTDGQAYYALALSLSAGGRVDPRQAHRRGLQAVQALTTRADAILRSRGRTRGSVTARLAALAREPEHLYPATDAGKDQAVAEMNASLARARAALPRAFSRGPEAPGVVRRMSAADEAAGRPGRREPGAYVVDLIRIRSRPRWTLPSVVHHELQPGHQLQEALLAPGRSHPLLARYAPGYGEGWAIYAETLADELGLFDADPLGRLGYLHWMLFRMGRLVVDTGVHARGWSRERAIDELRSIQGDPIAFISIEEDVDRMIASPGAAGGQALAALDIARLRAESRGRLGGRFTLQGFHDAILGRGPVSTAGLTQAVALWEAQMVG